LSRLRSRKLSPKKAVKSSKAPRSRRVAKPMKKTVSSKTRNWLHAKARSVRYGHRPRTVIIGIVSGLFSTVLLGLWLSGHLNDVYRASQDYAQSRLLDAGFGVDHINIAGARFSSEAEVRKVLGVEKGELVFAVNLSAARARVESLGWVQKASVTRLLPNRISVVITERTPFAIWQNKQSFSLISAEGAKISSADPERYANLPVVVGPGAGAEAASLLSDLAMRREFSNRVRFVVRVSDRRWNLNFDSGAKLLLPATGWKQVLDELSRSESVMEMFDIPKVVVDARISGRISVRKKKRSLRTKRTMIS